MPTLELVSHHLCPYVQRAAIVLDEKAVAHTRTYVDLTAKPDWFTRISPLGRVPLLKVDDAVLFESAVICEYIDETTPGRLHPHSPLDRARHRAWIEFASAVLAGIAAFYSADSAASFELRATDLRAKFQRLEAELGDGPFFAGPRFHIVDAAYAPIFRYLDAFDRIAGLAFLEGLPRTQAYRTALAERASVRAAVSSTYPQALWQFLRARPSHLARLLPPARAA